MVVPPNLLLTRGQCECSLISEIQRVIHKPHRSKRYSIIVHVQVFLIAPEFRDHVVNHGSQENQQSNTEFDGQSLEYLYNEFLVRINYDLLLLIESRSISFDQLDREHDFVVFQMRRPHFVSLFFY